MLFVIMIVVISFAVWAFCRSSGNSSSKKKTHEESRYARTGSYMDFDPGVDFDKIGNPKYPNAGMESVMKQEFMEDLLDEDKN